MVNTGQNGADSLNYHIRMFVTARVTKFANAFTTTMANLVTKTINIFKYNIKMDLRGGKN